MKPSLRWSLSLAGAVLIGVAAWKVTSRPLPLTELSEQSNGTATTSETLSSNSNVAVVGDTPITRADLDWEVALHTTVPQIQEANPAPSAPNLQDKKGASPRPTTSPDSKPILAIPSDALQQRLLVTLIERKMLFQWIKEYSEGFDFSNPSRYIDCLSELKEILALSPDFFANDKNKERLKTKLCEQSLIEQYLNEKITGSIAVSEEEVAQWYKQHSTEFNDPPKVVFRQILLPTDKAAVSLRPKVNRNNFSEMAKLHSIASEASQGGKVGPFAKEQLPSFFDIVFTMQIGEISNIVRSDYGYHILMAVDKLPARKRSLSEVRSQIRAKLIQQKKQEAYQSWLTSVMNTITVTSTVKDPMR